MPASLMNLQNLEKDFHSFEEQVSRLDSILQSQTSTGQSRHQWALRWLLKKLHSSSPDGQTARACWRGWDLLHTLLKRVSSSVVAQTCKQYDLLESSVQALESTFEQGGTPVQILSRQRLHPTIEPTNVAEDGESRKRKQGSESEPSKKRRLSSGEASTNKHLVSLETELFRSIFSVILDLSGELSDNGSLLDSSLEDFPLPTSHIDRGLAGRLLRSGLVALHFFLLSESEDRLSNASSPNIHLRALLQVWKRSMGADKWSLQAQEDDRHGVTATFAFLCLASVRDKREKCSTLVKATSSWDSMIYELETFLARYEVNSLRTRLQEMSPNDLSPVTSVHIDDVTNEKLSSLTALRLDLISENLAEKTSEQFNPSVYRDLVDAGVEIFKTAIKYSSLASPKQRTKQLHWVRNLMLHLFVSFIHLPSHTKVYLYARRNAFRKVLKAGSECKLTLGDSAWVHEILKQAGIEGDRHDSSRERDIDWHICHLTVKVAPQAFIPGLQREGLDSGFERLMQALSHVRCGVQQHYDQMDGRDIITNELFPTLVHSFVNARAQIEFLSAWHENLLAAFATLSSTNLIDVSILEHRDVIRTVSTLLIPTITAQQKLDAISSLTSDEPPAPALIVLEAIIDGLRSDEVLEELQLCLQRIIRRCTDLLVAANVSPLEHVIIWRVIGITYQLWLKKAPKTSIESCLETSDQVGDLAGQLATVFKEAENQIGSMNSVKLEPHEEITFQRAVQSLNSIASIVKALQCRHVSGQLITTVLDPSKVVHYVVSFCKKTPVLRYRSAFLGLLRNNDVLLKLTINTDAIKELLFLDVNEASIAERSTKWSSLNGLFRSKATSSIITRPLIHQPSRMESDTLVELLRNENFNLHLVVELRKTIPSSLLTEVERIKVLEVIVGDDTILDSLQKLSLWQWCTQDFNIAPVAESYLNLLMNFAESLDQSQSAFESKIIALNSLKTFKRISTDHSELIEQQVDQHATLTSTWEKFQETLSNDVLNKPFSLIALCGLAAILRNSGGTNQRKQTPLDIQDHLCSRICTETIKKIVNEEVAGNEILIQNALDMITMFANKGAESMDCSYYLQKLLLVFEENPEPTSSLQLAKCKVLWHYQLATDVLPKLAAALECVKDVQELTKLNLHSMSETVGDVMSLIAPNQRSWVLEATFPLGSPAIFTQPQLLLLEACLPFLSSLEASALNTLLSSLTQTLSATTSFATLDLTLTFIHHTLSLKPTRPTQSILESVMTSLTTLLSPTASAFNRAHPRKIYTHLTPIVRVILTRNTLRKHLRGRDHLLVPLLQGLMRALFVPLNRAANLRHPPWLGYGLKSVTNDGRPKRLLPRHVEAFTRLITLLCDPPYGAVSSQSLSHNKPTKATEELTDPLIAARTIAANVAPLLLGELSNCMLKGRYCHDGAREALRPGVWAMLDVVKRYGVGVDELGIIVGMESAREVLRGLVTEWKRIGGG